MVRVDRDLKRCYFYRIKIEGDVKKPVDLRSPSPEFPKSGIPKQDIIPYNPHYRERASRQMSRPPSTRRISWSREADRVREISPRSQPDPEPVKMFYPPPPRKAKSFSEDPDEEKYPLTRKKSKPRKKRSITPKPKPIKKSSPEPIFEPVYHAPVQTKISKPKVPKKKTEQLIRQQRDQRYNAQKLEQKKRSQQNSSNLRKVKSESNLKSMPKETLMKKSETGKTKHFHPPRWRHVGDRNRRRQGDKNSRSFASDYYF